MRRHPPVPCYPFALNLIVQVGASETHQAFREYGRAQQRLYPPPVCNLGSKGFQSNTYTAGSVNFITFGPIVS